MSELQVDTCYQPLIESFTKSNFLIIFNKIDKATHDLIDHNMMTINEIVNNIRFIIFLRYCMYCEIY